MNTRFLRLAIGLFLTLSTVNCNKKDAVTTQAELEQHTESVMVQGSYTSSNNSIFGYWLYIPEHAVDNMPLIIYLHGGSGRGNDLNLVTNGSLPQFLKEGSVKTTSAFILMPQCPTDKTWEQIGTTIKELIDKIIMEKKINNKKISLTGHSLGGTGTWNLGASYSALFSCIVPLSGSVNMNNASSYKTIPIWAFVGSNDTTVDPVSSQHIVPAINSAGGNAQIKTYMGATHFDVPSLVYKDQSIKILEWMSSQMRN